MLLLSLIWFIPLLEQEVFGVGAACNFVKRSHLLVFLAFVLGFTAVSSSAKFMNV